MIGTSLTVLHEADFAEDTIYSFGSNFITCFGLSCIGWCAVFHKMVSGHFAANANSLDTFLGLFKTLTHHNAGIDILCNFICEAHSHTTAKFTIINDSNGITRWGKHLLQPWPTSEGTSTRCLPHVANHRCTQH